MAVEFDRSLVRRDQAHDHIKDGRLSGAVRTEQTDSLSAPDGYADVLYDHTALVPFAEVMDGKHPLPPDNVGSSRAGRRRRSAPLGVEPPGPAGGGVLAQQVFAHDKMLASASIEGSRWAGMPRSYLGFAGSAPLAGVNCP